MQVGVPAAQRVDTFQFRLVAIPLLAFRDVWGKIKKVVLHIVKVSCRIWMYTYDFCGKWTTGKDDGYRRDLKPRIADPTWNTHAENRPKEPGSPNR